MDQSLINAPEWAWRRVSAAERQMIQDMLEEDRVKTNWYEVKDLRSWAKAQDWPTPWFNFQKSFMNKMVENETNFALVLAKSGLKVYLLKTEYEITADTLQSYDAFYAEGDYRWLVESLREIRRAIEAGVEVRVEGKRLTSFDKFYTWAHGRYHGLEDDPNTGWIGDDSKYRW